MKTKLIGALVVVFMFIMFGLSPVSASSPLRIFVNGQEAVIPTAPIIVDDRTLVPASLFAVPVFGVEVNWDRTAKQVRITNQAMQLILKIDSTNVLVNGQENSMEVAPRLVKGIPMVPLRFLCDTLGVQIKLAEDGKRIELIKAAQSVTLQIDQTIANVNQREVKLDVSPQLVEGRTLVPLRFVAEAFGAEVFWNGQTQGITVQRGQQMVTLQIGNLQARVNGREVCLDVPPQLVKDRTLIPVRFVAEALGAEVDWEATSRRVVITQPGNLKHVLAYYYGGSYQEFLANADKLNQVAFRWFETNGQGEILTKYPDSYESVLKFVQDKKIAAAASIFLSDPEQLHILLNSPENRRRLIDNALKLVDKDGYQGINLDLEMVKAEDRDGLNLLVKEFRDQLKPRNLELSLALPPKNADTKWFAAYDYTILGGLADRVVIMAHDLHWKGGPAGPIAPLAWVESVLQFAKTQIPSDKILLALGVYGYDWPERGTARSYTPAQLAELMCIYNVSPEWDSAAQSPYFTYRDSQEVNHTVWFEDDRSLRQKMNLPEQYGIAGISLWKLGNGFPEMWQAIERRIK
ncbi:MAG: hypothetical protein HPY81_01360 [Firmicutes bacterium]|nr:hypothetical protein [Bacillota bacterium]